MKKSFPALCALFILFQNARADGEAASWRDNLRATWESENHTVIVPVNTYHSRLTYDKEHIKRYNEMPWGLGVERFYVDEKRNRHSFYALAFAASYGHVQPVVGYTWEKSVFLNDSHSARLGLGCTAVITARRQNDYIPFPGVLPIASLGYRGLAIHTSWVPYGGRNWGNVYLTVLKISV